MLEGGKSGKPPAGAPLQVPAPLDLDDGELAGVDLGVPRQMSFGLPALGSASASMPASAMQFFSPLPSMSMTPGSIPLIVSTPDSAEFQQVEVPSSATIGQLKWLLASELNMKNVDISIGNGETMADNSTLEEHGIPQMYNAAGAACWVADELSGQDKERALKPVLKVMDAMQRGEETVRLHATSGEYSDSPTRGTTPPGAMHTRLRRKASEANSKKTSSSNLSIRQQTSSTRELVNDPVKLVSVLGESYPDLYRKSTVDKFMSAYASGETPPPPPSALLRGLSNMTWGAGTTGGFPTMERHSDPAASGVRPQEGEPSPAGHGTWVEELKNTWQADLTNAEELDMEGDRGCEEDEDEEDGRYYSGQEYEGTDGGAPSSEAGGDHHGMNGPSGADARQPKKRGRKRKFPELTEEQRAELRKIQNRESAKKSRERKKVLNKDYETMIDGVLVENQQLKSRLETLSQRLEMMQRLLAVQVKPSAPLKPSVPR
ncbi:hypothetical protein FVE85_4883 [Porphyridium purpureum]|uniref:BZIP domain-containing protein n=1 Tax=Porphyridium purpureum TaxID=35688 RepID=A0A5J4YR32_PORPP|nr:hypothetical protein FVE85_4883 [Porphyridium purpureum]|eukprot:POR5622..scf236_6